VDRFALAHPRVSLVLSGPADQAELEEALRTIERGPMSDQELALSEARTKLTQARTEIHAFNPATVDPVVDDGLKILAGVAQAGERALADLRFRRRGLFASLAAILLVVIALAFKIRELDRRRAAASHER
jgi:hypothetical protein